MRRVFLAVLFTVLSAACASAQTYTGFAWDQQADAAATAQGWQYRAYYDSATTGVTLTNVACVGTAAPWTCSAVAVIPFGAHSVALTSALADGSAESGPSVAVTFVQGPPIPVSIRPKK